MTDAPTPTPDTPPGAYGELHAHTRDLVRQLEQLATTEAVHAVEALQQVEGHADQWRDLRDELRAALHLVEEHSARHDRLVAGLRAIAATSSGVELRGRAIADAAIACLTGPGPVSLQDWYQQFANTGAVIPTRNPYATFIVEINRHPGIRRVGRGTYQLADQGDA